MSATPYEVILAPNPSLFTGPGTNTYVVGDGPDVLVVDPGPSIPSHIDAVAVAVARRGRATALLLTHHHPDHSEAAAELSRRLRAPLRGRPHELSPHLEPLDDGEDIVFSGGTLRTVATPGHCADHLCFHWRDTGALFAGDLVAETGYIVIDPPDGNMAAYLDSLKRVDALNPKTLLPAHGNPITDPHAHLTRYVEHRLAREHRVITGLRDLDAATEAELLAVVYDDTPLEIHPIATRSLLAHLIKLEAEGRISVRRGAGPTEYRLKS